LPATGVTIAEDLELRAVNAVRAAIVIFTVDVDATITVAVGVAIVASSVAETSSRDANTSSVVKLRVSLIEVLAVTGNDSRLVVLPGERAVAVRMLPRMDGVSQLSGRAELSVNRAVVAVDLATVLGQVIAVEPVLFALIQAVSGPAVLIREVVNGVPEREVTVDGVDTNTTNSVESVVVEAVAVHVDPRDSVDVLGPITTVALRGNGVGTEVDVVLSSEGGVAKISRAIVRGAGVIVALPVLIVELTSEVAIELERNTVEVELGLEALTVLLGTVDDGTGTNTDTTSPVTVAGSRAGRPLGPGGNVAMNLGGTNVDVAASAERGASKDNTVGINTVGVAVSSRVLGAGGNAGEGADGTELVTGPREKLGIVNSERGVRAPRVLVRPVLRTPEENVVDVINDLSEVEVSVIDAVTESTTVLVVSTEVGNDLGETVIVLAKEVARSTPGTINRSPDVPVRVAVREAVEVLNEGKVANTTVGSLRDDSASANAGHEEVVTTDAIVLVRALAPVRPLRKDAVNGVVVNITMEGPGGSIRGLVDVSEVVRSIVEESNLTTSEPDRGSEEMGTTNNEGRIREAEVRGDEAFGTTGKTSNRRRAVAPVELTESQRRSITGLNDLEDLDIVVDVIGVAARLGIRERSESILVLVEAVLIGVADVGDEVGVSVLRVTIVVETTTAVLLSRLATVRPVVVEVTAELGLAGTVVAIRRIKAGVQVVDGGIAVEVSDTLVLSGVEGQASGGRGSSPATVGVVRTEGTLEDGAVNALVLTARDVSLVRAGVARTSKGSLATVARVLVAVSEASLAGEEAATSVGGGSVTVAKDGTIGKHVGKVNLLRAVNGGINAGNGSVGLRRLATGGPVVIGVLAE
jgi:hypothetical protein